MIDKKRENNVVELPYLRDRVHIFRDRHQAGEVLADLLENYRHTDALVLGIPSGGVPVAVAVAHRLGLDFDVAVTSKITLPWNTEVGYGGVAFDGTVVLNGDVLPHMGLTQAQIDAGIERTREKVARRLQLLRGEEPLPPLVGRTVILVDDGLATGSTVHVTAIALRKANVENLVVAVPTGHQDTVVRVAREVEFLYCANIRGGWRFAVAEAYEHWFDMEEAEVADILAVHRSAVHQHHG